jgi:hypothetical protein
MTSLAKTRTRKYIPKVRIIKRHPHSGPADYTFVWREPVVGSRLFDGRQLPASLRRTKTLRFINSQSAQEWMALKLYDLKRTYDGVKMVLMPKKVRGPEDE